MQQGADIEAKNKDGETALYFRAYEGDLEAVKYLVKQDADINTEDKYGWTTFHRSVHTEHLDVVKCLLQKRADIISTKHKRGETALHIAACKGSLEMIKHLVGYGANIYAKNNKGKMAINLARENIDRSVAEFLRRKMSTTEKYIQQRVEEEKKEQEKKIFKDVIARLLSSGMDKEKAAEVLGLTLKELEDHLSP